MRFLVTNVVDHTGHAVARALLAAGHRVTGLAPAAGRGVDPRIDLHVGTPDEAAVLDRAVAEPPELVLHLPGRFPDRATPLAAAVGAVRVVVLLPDEPAAAERIAAAWADRPGTLLVRTAPLAGRAAGPAEMRTIAGLLTAPADSRWSLVHPDDVARVLVEELLEGRTTGTLRLAAPGTVTAGDAARRLRAAGVRRVPRGVRPHPVPPPVAAVGGFTTGWTAEEAFEDLLRGLVDRVPDADGARDRPGAITLPAEVIPSRMPARDGGPLRSAAPDGLEGEFDELIDPRFPVQSATNVSEALPGPLTALSIDLHAAGLRHANAVMGRMMALDGVVADEWTSRVDGVYGHRVYLNASISVLTAANLPGWSEESMREQAFAALPPDLALHPLGRPRTPSGAAAVRAQATVVGRLGAVALRYKRSAETVNAAAHAEAITATQAAALSDERLHAELLLGRDRLHQAWAAAAIGVMMTGAATNVHEQVGRRTGGPSGIDLEALDSARTVLAVDRLAALLRQEPRLRDLAAAGDVDGARARSAELAAALDRELERIGHRGPGECEIANPVFADRPGMLLTAAAHAAAGAPRVRAEVIGSPEVPRGLAGRTARLAAGATVAREHARDGVVRVVHRVRVLTRERGARLVAAGVLDAAEDVVHLTLDELLYPPADARERVGRRRAERARLKAVRMPDVFSGHWEQVAGGARLGAGESITGLGVSPGTVEGPVRILRDSDDEIEPGDVLVAAVTDVGYTSMFGYAAAVVTDIGGSASHAAIVAREYGVPCVVDTKVATAALADGQRVRVDGVAGTVTVLTDVPVATP